MSRVRNRLEKYKAEIEKKSQYKHGLPGSALDIVNSLLDDLEQDEKENGWIPVSERLPEDGTYITTLDGELVGQEEPFTGMCGIENEKWDDEDCVIAWMPLPEPYKEE
ncbi:MAG: DUF551 domain-containing protein [Ruminococcus sp.]